MNITNLQGSIGLLHSSEPKSDALEMRLMDTQMVIN